LGFQSPQNARRFSKTDFAPIAFDNFDFPKKHLRHFAFIDFGFLDFPKKHLRHFVSI